MNAGNEDLGYLPAIQIRATRSSMRLHTTEAMPIRYGPSMSFAPSHVMSKVRGPVSVKVNDMGDDGDVRPTQAMRGAVESGRSASVCTFHTVRAVSEPGRTSPVGQYGTCD